MDISYFWDDIRTFCDKFGVDIKEYEQLPCYYGSGQISMRDDRISEKLIDLMNI